VEILQKIDHANVPLV